MMEMINKNGAKSEISMIFVQLTSSITCKVFKSMECLLVLGLKECLVECAIVYVKSVVILTNPECVSKCTFIESNDA